MVIESVVRDPSDGRSQVSEQRRRAGVWLLCHREVATAAVDLDLATVDSKDTTRRYVAQTPHVQAAATRRDLNVCGRHVRKDSSRPRFDPIVCDAVVKVETHDAITIEDEAEAVTDSAGRCGGEGCPSACVGAASAATLDSDGTLRIMAHPAVAITQRSRYRTRAGMAHAMGSDAAASRAVARIGSRDAGKRTMAVLACARVEHDQIVSRICNGCKSRSRDNAPDVTAKERRGIPPIAAREIVSVWPQRSDGGGGGPRSEACALRGAQHLQTCTGLEVSGVAPENAAFECSTGVANAHTRCRTGPRRPPYTRRAASRGALVPVRAGAAIGRPLAAGVVSSSPAAGAAFLVRDPDNGFLT